MSYFNKCPTCGSNLDPGEKCECSNKKATEKNKDKKQEKNKEKK